MSLEPPPVLDEAQRVLLRAMLNRIVPARSDLAGAGDLDVGASIERTLAASPRLRRLFLDGLREIAITAQHEAGLPFMELESARQTVVMKTIEQRWPAFFIALVEHTYRGYYTLPAVQLAVGFEPRPPQPLGHQLAPFDPALLDQQRQRAPFWRPTN
jgi:Gluconate 2-dehydrogenase subunit 3